MNISRLRLITFDVTNTLLKFRSEPGRQYGEIGAMFGVLCDKAKLLSSFKSSYVQMSQEHPNFGQTSGLGWEEWWRQVVIGTFKGSTFDVEQKKLDAISTHLIEMYKTSACWQHCYGAQGLLSYLRNKKIPMGCISNFDPRLNTILENNKLKHFFQFTLGSYEVGHEKPDTRIFERAMAESGLKNLLPDECLHIGNSVKYDYIGATQSGWNPLLVHDRPTDQILEMFPQVDKELIFRSLYDYHKDLLLANEPHKISSLKETYLH